MIISKETISDFEQRYRTAFINSLAGFRQAVLVGTKSKDGLTNLAIFNSLIHLGANPALFGLISRPEKVPRDTLKNILETREYTLNLVQHSYYKHAHKTSARYPSDVSEFEQAGFSEYYHEAYYPPFVGEAIIKIAMKFEEKIDITINNTVLIIGSIQQIELDEALIEADGFVNLHAAKVLISQGLDAYFVSESIGRLPYAKP
ncbi:MAG: flavin reductase [Gemmatimonadaceae bacterium]|nr:flavin reductase [Chitinophagaceae bacterium]